MGPLIHASHSRRGVALAEGDEHPDQLALRVAGDLEDESEGALLGGRIVARGPVGLGALS